MIAHAPPDLHLNVHSMPRLDEALTRHAQHVTCVFLCVVAVDEFYGTRPYWCPTLNVNGRGPHTSMPVAGAQFDLIKEIIQGQMEIKEGADARLDEALTELAAILKEEKVFVWLDYWSIIPIPSHHIHIT